VNSTVFVVDDDEPLRDSLRALLGAAGLASLAFASAQEFLDSYDGQPGCLLLDVRMPGMSGLSLQDELSRRRVRLPVVFMTGHGDVPIAVQAIKKGALDFIEKPYRDEDLLALLRRALAIDAEQRGADAVLAALTQREREVLDHLLAGRTGRATAEALGVSAKTIEFHRARIMQKLNVRTREELYRLCRVSSPSSAASSREITE
jgi:FixJ family two-component response regulator